MRTENAEGVYQLPAQGCARRRATLGLLGLRHMDLCNPERVVSKHHMAPVNSRTLSEFHLPKAFVSRGRCPGLEFANAFGVHIQPKMRQVSQVDNHRES